MILVLPDALTSPANTTATAPCVARNACEKAQVTQLEFIAVCPHDGRQGRSLDHPARWRHRSCIGDARARKSGRCLHRSGVVQRRRDRVERTSRTRDARGRGVVGVSLSEAVVAFGRPRFGLGVSGVSNSAGTLTFKALAMRSSVSTVKFSVPPSTDCK